MLENIKLFSPKIDTAPKIGIEIKKDILAASTRLKFNSLAAVIPIPDRLTPGSSDKICRSPINNAVLKEKSFCIVFCNLNLSLIKRIIPNNLCANIDLDKIKTQKIFKWLKNIGVSNDEMLKTFNCGVGFCLIINKKNLNKSDFFLAVRPLFA